MSGTRDKKMSESVQDVSQHTGIEKRCSKCGEVKKSDKFYVDAREKTDGFYSACKDCHNAARVLKRSQNSPERSTRAIGPKRNSCPARAKKHKTRKAQESLGQAIGIERMCSKCKQVKEINKFSKDSSHADGLRSSCKACAREYDSKRRMRDPRLREKNKVYAAAWLANFRKNNPREYIHRRLWYSAKRRAKMFNIPFDIKKEDVVFDDFCPVFGTRFIYDAKGLASPQSPSLDRITPGLGYVKGNICVISQRANVIKSNISLEDFQKITSWYQQVLYPE